MRKTNLAMLKRVLLLVRLQRGANSPCDRPDKLSTEDAKNPNLLFIGFRRGVTLARARCCSVGAIFCGFCIPGAGRYD